MLIRHKLAVRLYGIIWLAVGFMLMFKGIPLIVKAALQEKLPLIAFFQPLVGSAEQAALVVVVLGLLVGFIKGKTVLAKAARRSIERLKLFSNPLPVSRLFSFRYLVLLAIMMSLGMALKLFPLPQDLHGMIDLAVGSGLINGALVYFRESLLMVRGTPTNL